MTSTAKAGASRAITIAWLVTAAYYFYQYSLRSAPGVMMPQLSEVFGLGTAAVASLVGLFYYGYSPFSLVAGVALDRLGPRKVVPIGALAVGAGALLFASGNAALASAGRLLQGAGGVFALVGAVYIATTWFPASRAATLIGATQMFGMAGGAAGQFAVGPLLASGVALSTFWAGMGIAGLVMGVVLFLLLPREEARASQPAWLREALGALGLVFRNPQSILCGIIAGLLFIPTTIFDMVWGVRYLQDARGLEYAEAVFRSASVPVGWIIGCPLLGFVSDRIGRRKPVIIASAMVLVLCLGWILHGRGEVLPPYTLGLVMGVASGAAMIPYTVIKEANPARVSGTSTGVINFINFTFSALLGPIFARRLMRHAGENASADLAAYQATFDLLLWGVGLAILLTFLLRETGPAAARPVSVPAENPS